MRVIKLTIAGLVAFPLSACAETHARTAANNNKPHGHIMKPAALPAVCKETEHVRLPTGVCVRGATYHGIKNSREYFDEHDRWSGGDGGSDGAAAQ